MGIPDFQSLMLPLLELCGNGDMWRFRDIPDRLADRFGLTDDERKAEIPSGNQPLFVNRFAWARTYMVKAGLLEAPQRGFLRITEEGKKTLAESPARIDIRYLSRFPNFEKFKLARSKNSQSEGIAVTSEEPTKTPHERMEEAYAELRNGLAQDILQKVKSCSPSFFERLVIEVLVKMGYGGSRADAGQMIGKSGDGGIDGIIKEDRLGLDVIYVQAKRWDNPIGRPQIQQFVGALSGNHARKGVFITTASFTKEAVDYARNLESKVVLVDGVQLAGYMIDYDIGVSEFVSYRLKRIDSDYYEEE
ncbi:MAG TPA: restriction endonuclease [Candidatus Latescibacteria bacterium]|nr:restriction endonuclease [Candidatus Latescibacterota bacterium]